MSTPHSAKVWKGVRVCGCDWKHTSKILNYKANLIGNFGPLKPVTHLCVSLYVSKSARVATAGKAPQVFIDAKFQAFGVHIVCKVLDAMRKSLWVSLQSPMCIPLSSHPAIVYVDKFISHILKSILCNPVSHLHKQILTDAVVRVIVTISIAGEPLPRKPAHYKKARAPSLS